MRPLLLIAVLLAAGPAVAEEVPVPRPRPAEADAASKEPPEPSACQLRMSAGEIAVAEILPPIEGPDECGGSDIVRLTEIVLPDHTHASVNPPATLRCEMSETVAYWVRGDVTSALAKFGAKLRAIDNFDSYECRGRNRVAGAKLSEHGRANALDVRGFRLADGRFLELTDRTLDRPLRETLRVSACAQFTTVLGPGSDGYHETHIHLDLAARRNGYRICQWDVLDPAPEIPLPRARPVEASTVQ